MGLAIMKFGAFKDFTNWYRARRTACPPAELAHAGAAATRTGTADATIWAAFQVSARRHGAAPALSDTKTMLSYAQVHARALALARRIAGMVPAGTPVAVVTPHGLGGMIALLAGLAAGRVSLIVNPDEPADRIGRILADGRPGLVVVPGNAITVPPGYPVLTFDPLAEVPDTEAAAPAGIVPDGGALVFYTSGSSGQPKGVVYSQGAVLYRAGRQQLSSGPRGEERLMLFSPISFMSGFLSAIGALISGACLLLPRPASPREILETIERQRVTAIKVLPRLLNVLLAGPRAREAFRSVHTVRTGAGAVLAADAAMWRGVLPRGCRLVHAYNQTEAGIAQWVVPAGFVADSATLPSGYLDPSIGWQILDPHGNPVRTGEIGELVVDGPNVAMGEWQDGRCVAGRITPHPDSPDRRVVRTGDLVRLRADRLLEVVGRGDRMVKILGNRVEPAEIESVLRGLPGIAEAAVEARLQDDIAVLYAFVSGVGGAIPDRRAVMATLRQRLPAYMLPGRLLTFPHLPKLPSGKIDLARMLALADQDHLSTGG